MRLQLDLNREYGLVLEGGGARGAYQIGAWRALREAGVRLRGVAGTSVGALNGALICMGDLEKAERLWEGIRYSQVMEIDDELMERLHALGLRAFASAGASGLFAALRRVLADGGLDIAPLRRLIEETVDEAAIRACPLEFYSVTYSLSDHRPLVVDLKATPEGEMGEMLLASAYLLGFKRERLGGKYYMDGARANNVPADVLIERGYRDLIVLRIYGLGVDTERRLQVPEGVVLHHVAPRFDLGGILEFDRRRARRNLALGYFDAMRMLYGLAGRSYYLDAPEGEAYYFERMMAEGDLFGDWLEGMKTESAGPRTLTQQRFPRLARRLGLGEGWSYRELWLALAEELARKNHISRFQVYTASELAALLYQRMARGPERTVWGRNWLDSAEWT